jgi:hypothetical protein
MTPPAYTIERCPPDRPASVPASALPAGIEMPADIAPLDEFILQVREDLAARLAQLQAKDGRVTHARVGAEVERAIRCVHDPEGAYGGTVQTIDDPSAGVDLDAIEADEERAGREHR